MTIFFLAILAGLLTILAPCILPVLPFILGTAGRSRWRPVMIIAGFVASFSVLGAAFATVGSFLGLSNESLRLAAAVLLMIFGLALIFEKVYDRVMARLQPVLARWSARLSGGAARRADAASGLLVGVSLGLVWTPCAGPILGSILTLASRTTDYLTVLLLMFAYSLGAGLPMLAIAYGGQALTARLLKLGAWQRIFNGIFGALMLAMGILIITHRDVTFVAWLFSYYPASFTSRL